MRVVVVTLLGVAAVTYAQVSNNSKSTTYILTDLPPSYCPTAVQGSKLVNGQEVPYSQTVEDCNNLTVSTAEEVRFMLPNALMIAVEPQPGQTVYLTPRLGETNGDGIIDETDLNAIEGGIFSAQFDPSLDADSDGRLTVLDRALVSQNLGLKVEL